MKPVTDPAILAQLNAQPPGLQLKPVTDPALLAQLNAPEQQAPNKPQVGMGEGILSALEQGMTFGFNDEISAALNAAGHKLMHPSDSFADTYNANVANYRNRLHQFHNEHPVVATTAEITGSVPTAFVPLGAVGRLAEGGNLIVKGLTNVGIGAAGGALYGAGAGDSGDKAKSAIEGAAMGSAGGFVAPIIGAGVRNLTKRLMTGSAAKQVGMTRPAYDILKRATEADQTISGTGAANIRAAGPKAMLADAGHNTMSLLDTAVQSSGPASTAATNAITERTKDASRAIKTALDDAFGQPAGIRTTETNIRRSTAPARQDAYDIAYGKSIDYTSPVGQDIEALIVNRVPRSAIAKANALMRAEGKKSSEIKVVANPDGTVTFKTMPDVRQIDYITRGLNEVADRANGQGVLGGTTQTGRAYSGLSRELRDLTRQAVPEYGAALNTAAEPIAARKALQLGRKVLSPSLAGDDLQHAMAGMTDAEKSFVAQGARSQIDSALANVKRAITDPSTDTREAVAAVKALSSRAARDKVAQVIGPAKAATLFDQLDRATKAFELRAAVAQNSKTFARTALNDAIRAQVEDGVLNALRRGELPTTAKRALQMVTGRTAADNQRAGDKTYSSLVEALTGPRGADAALILDRMRDAAPRLAATPEKVGRLTRLLLQRNAAADEQARERLYP